MWGSTPIHLYLWNCAVPSSKFHPFPTSGVDPKEGAGEFIFARPMCPGKAGENHGKGWEKSIHCPFISIDWKFEKMSSASSPNVDQKFDGSLFIIAYPIKMTFFRTKIPQVHTTSSIRDGPRRASADDAHKLPLEFAS